MNSYGFVQRGGFAEEMGPVPCRQQKESFAKIRFYKEKVLLEEKRVFIKRKILQEASFTKNNRKRVFTNCNMEKIRI